MAHKQAAIKHIRQTKIRTERNKSVQRVLKSTLKKTHRAIDAKAGDVETLVRGALKTIDKATQHGVLKKNTAARTKSRLMKRVRKAVQAA